MVIPGCPAVVSVDIDGSWPCVRESDKSRSDKVISASCEHKWDDLNVNVPCGGVIIVG